MLKTSDQRKGNSEQELFQNLKTNLLELFFPSHCAFCNRLGSFLCNSCRINIIEAEVQTCLGCNRITQKGKYCQRCRSKHELTGLISCGYFKDEILKEAIHVFKYEKVSGMEPLLADLLIKKIKEEKMGFDLVFFVPITKKREAWRGFNQAELLAKEVALAFKVPVGTIKKVKETKTQVGLAKKERQKNLRDAFRVIEPKTLAGKRILVIDDVVTTGTTLNECAKVLRKNGARTVWAAVLAKE